MGRWLALLVLGLSSLTQFALAQKRLEVTELKGGSVMTDVVSANDRTHPIRWMVIDQSSCPVVEKLAACVSVVTHVHFPDGKEWTADTEAVNRFLRGRSFTLTDESRLIR